MKSEEDGTFITFEMPCGTFSFRNRKRKKNVEEALLSAIECILIINLLFVAWWLTGRLFTGANHANCHFGYN